MAPTTLAASLVPAPAAARCARLKGGVCPSAYGFSSGMREEWLDSADAPSNDGPFVESEVECEVTGDFAVLVWNWLTGKGANEVCLRVRCSSGAATHCGALGPLWGEPVVTVHGAWTATSKRGSACRACGAANEKAPLVTHSSGVEHCVVSPESGG